MRQLELTNVNLLDFGNNILLGGVIYSGNDTNYICMIPNEGDINDEFCILDLDTEDWKQVIRQTDIMETEILQKAADGKITKATIRKSTRIIEQGISWRVYKRDNYQCRYCGIDGIPMTVDHLVLWEEGGPSIEENLLTSCRKCNKTRGRMQYADWLNSRYYQKVSQNISPEIKILNSELVGTLKDIPIRLHTRSR